MGRFRSLLRRFIKPAAMVGTVGVLSLGLVITTPSNALAFQKYPKIPPTATFIMGATKTVAPAAMAVASFTPVGWGLRLYQLGMLAYSTSDIWMPFVAGAFGAGKPNDYAAPTTGTRIEPTFSINTATMSGVNASVGWYWGSGAIGQNLSVAITSSCKRADGSTWKQQRLQNVSAEPSRRTGTVSFPCVDPVNGNIGGTLVGFIAGTPGGHPDLWPYASSGNGSFPGPNNIIQVGTLANPDGFDPLGEEVGYQGRSECIDPSGAISWAEGPIIPGNNGAMLMPSCEKAGKGHGTGRTTVTGFKPDGGTETVWDTGTNPLFDPATPLCDPGRATSGCTLEVTKDGNPCTTGDVECENWSGESKKEPNTRYGCKLGPYTLPISACSLLERAYERVPSPVNDENTDGNPDTRSPAGPTGDPAPVQPPTVTGTVPGVPTVPGGSGQPGPADEKARQCFPTGWAAFNPIEWVLKPLRCAFEPTQSPQDMVTRLGIRSATKAPISFLNMEMTGPGSSGCPSWVITLPGFSQNVVCESSFTSAILSIRLPLFGILSAAMVWPLLRSLWYAAIPILRVTPSGGK